mgnify:CR=1 FL=1
MKERFWFLYYWLMIVAGILGTIELSWVLLEYISYNSTFLGLFEDLFFGVPFIVFPIVMTVIRWIVIGKHIWNRP